MGMVHEASAKGVESRKQIADDFASTVKPAIEAMKAQGMSYQAIAKGLDRMGAKTARGGAWTARAVINAASR